MSIGSPAWRWKQSSESFKGGDAAGLALAYVYLQDEPDGG
jgi:hypothetical protein